MTRDLLLQLYDHTLEVRLWNAREKVTPRARFDRPRAFRLPTATATAAPSVDGTGPGGRPDKFSLVGQQMERPSCQARRRRSRIAKKISSTSSISEGDSDLDLNSSISELYI